MIRWCSYCQTFTGLTAPLNDFSVTHGICDKCVQIGITNVKIDERLLAKKTFYNGLFSKVEKGIFVDPEFILAECKNLNLKSQDLFLGVLHPLLWKIGQYFENGKISVEKEHLFSQAVNELLDKLPEVEVENHVCVLFLLAQGNTHNIGIHFFQRLLKEQMGVSSIIIPDSPRNKTQMLELINRYQPKYIGISVALPEHLTYLSEVLPWLQDSGAPKLLVGGAAVSHIERNSLPGNSIKIAEIFDPYDTLSALQSVKELCRTI